VSSAEADKLGYFLASACLVLSTYASLRLTFQDRRISILSTYMTAFSTQTVVGLYGGYLANWLAGSLLMLMSAIAVSVAEGRRLRWLPLAVLLSALALFTHPWSWFVYMFAMLVFLLSLALFNKAAGKRKIVLASVFSLIAIGLTLDYFKQSMGLLGGAESVFPLLGSMSLTNLVLFQRNTYNTLQVFVGGYLCNYLILSLSIIGVLCMLGFAGRMPRFLLVLGLVTSAPVFLVYPNVQARLLYLMPFNIYSTLGCSAVLKLANRVGVNEGLLMTFILLLLANYGFRSVANLI